MEISDARLPFRFEGFQDVAPRRQGPAPGAAVPRARISRDLSFQYRALMAPEPSEIEKNHAQMRSHDLAMRYDRQQGVYARNTCLKRKMAYLIKKSNQKFTAVIRNFRVALKDMRRAQNSKDPVYIRAAIGRLLQCGTSVTGALHEMMNLATGVNKLDGEIKGVSDLVKRDEIEQRRDQPLCVMQTLQDASAIDAAPHLEVGQFEKEWAAATTRDAMSALEDGIQMIDGALEQHRNEDKERRKGALPAFTDRSFAQYEVAVKLLRKEQGSLSLVLASLGGR